MYPLMYVVQVQSPEPAPALDDRRQLCTSLPECGRHHRTGMPVSYHSRVLYVFPAMSRMADPDKPFHKYTPGVSSGTSQQVFRRDTPFVGNTL